MTNHPPQSSTTTTSSARQLQTYHCLCTNHLITTTHTLASLPRRKKPALDHAYILPCPRPAKRVRRLFPQPKDVASSTEDDGEDGSNDGDHAHHGEEVEGGQREDSAASRALTVLHNTPVHLRDSERPIIITREDGFEKRWLWKCGRCGLTAGYWLGWPNEEGNAAEEGQGKMGVVTKNRDGRRPDVLHILPGALVTTADMKQGKMGEGTKVK